MNTTKIVKQYESTKQGVVDNKVFQHLGHVEQVRKAYIAKFLKAMKNAINIDEFMANRQFTNNKYAELNMHAVVDMKDDRPLLEFMMNNPLRIR